MIYVIFTMAVLVWIFGRRVMDRENLRLTLPVWMVLVGLLVTFLITAMLGGEEIVYTPIMHKLTAVVLFAAGCLCLLVSLFAGTAPVSNTRARYQMFWLLLGIAFMFAGADKLFGWHRSWEPAIGDWLGMRGKEVTLLVYATLAVGFLALFRPTVAVQGLAGGRLAGAWLFAGLFMFFVAAFIDIVFTGRPGHWTGTTWWFDRLIELEEFCGFCAALLWLSSGIVALVESDRTAQLRSAPALPRRWHRDIEEDETAAPEST